LRALVDEVVKDAKPVENGEESIENENDNRVPLQVETMPLESEALGVAEICSAKDNENAATIVRIEIDTTFVA